MYLPTIEKHFPHYLGAKYQSWGSPNSYKQIPIFIPFTVFGSNKHHHPLIGFCFIQTQWVPTKTTITCSSWSSSEIRVLASPTSCPDSPETSSAWRPNPPSASNSPREASPLIASSSWHKSGTLQAKKGHTYTTTFHNKNTP